MLITFESTMSATETNEAARADDNVKQCEDTAERSAESVASLGGAEDRTATGDTLQGGDTGRKMGKFTKNSGEKVVRQVKKVWGEPE